jgi:hypothetical protein
MENYKMDRSIATKLTFKQADDHVTFYKDKTYFERLNDACFIINHIFQVTPTTKLDKTLIHQRKHDKPI